MSYQDGKWIYFHTAEKKRPDSMHGNPSPYFRKCFSVQAEIKEAKLYVSATGCFKAYVNGKPVSDDYLAPGRADYHKRLPLIKYDITEYVEKENAIGIVCGDGWAVGAVPFGNTFRRNCFSDEIYLYAVAEIAFEDGSVMKIGTDKSWKAGCGSVRYSSIYSGEFIDNREACAGFSEYGFNDSEWKNASEDMYPKNALLTLCDFPAIRPMASVKPVRSDENSGFVLFDFGKPVCGTLNFSASGRSGEKLGVVYSDSADISEITEGSDYFVLSGESDEAFAPMFSVHRFRYAAIFGAADISNVTAVEITSDVERTGDFYCSDTRINERFVNSTRIMKRRLLGIPEAAGFCGELNSDNALFDMYTYSSADFYRKYFADIRDAQLGNGFIPANIPVQQYGYRKITAEDAESMVSVFKTVYNHYVMFGDSLVLKENISMCKSLAGFIAERYDDMLVLSTVFLYMINICSAVRDGDAGYYKEKYNALKIRFRSRLTDGRTEADLLKDYVEAYEAGLLSADEIRANLVRCVKRGDEAHPHLLKVLCDAGERDLAYSLICDFTDEYTKASDITWLYSGMLGIKPVETADGAGFRKVVIEPAIDLSDRIKKAGGSCITPYGKISVFWEKTDDIYTCCLTVPFDIDATCRFSGFKVINQKCSRETYVFAMRKVIR